MQSFTWEICRPHVRLKVASNAFSTQTFFFPSPKAGLEHHSPLWCMLQVYRITTTAPCCSTSMFSGSIALAHPLTWHMENSCNKQLMNTMALGASKCLETGSTKFCSCKTKYDILFHLIQRIYNPLLVRLCELGKCLFKSYFPVAFYLHLLLDA